MRSTLRRADRYWRTVLDWYSAHLESLTDEGFDNECRRLFAGYTREQWLAEFASDENNANHDAEALAAYVDKLFQGRERL